MTCINFNPFYDTGQPVTYAAIIHGVDATSDLSFRRSVDLSSGFRSYAWCPQEHGDDPSSACGLPPGSVINRFLESSAKVTFEAGAQNTFGVYGCRAERLSWSTESIAMFMQNDGDFVFFW